MGAFSAFVIEKGGHRSSRTVKCSRIGISSYTTMPLINCSAFGWPRRLFDFNYSSIAVDFE